MPAEVDPTSTVAALIDSGSVHLAQGRVGPALEDFNAVVALGRADAAVFRARALARLRAGYPEAALADVDEALRLAPGDREAQDLRARIVARLKAIRIAQGWEPEAEPDIADRRLGLLAFVAAVVVAVVGQLALG